MTKKRLMWASVAAAAVLGASGCAVGAPGEAATVEGQTITIADAEQRAEDYNAALTELGVADPSAAMSTGGMVAVQVHALSTEAIAEDLGVRISAAEEDQATQQFFMGQEQILDDPRVGPLLQQDLRTQLLMSKMDQQQYQGAAAGLDVTVNPRFGVWTEQGMSTGNPMQPGSNGSLSKYSDEALTEFLRQQGR